MWRNYVSLSLSITSVFTEVFIVFQRCKHISYQHLKQVLSWARCLILYSEVLNSKERRNCSNFSELTTNLTWRSRHLWGNVKYFTIGSFSPGVSCKQGCQIAKVLCAITYCTPDANLRHQYSSFAKSPDMKSSCFASLKALFFFDSRMRAATDCQLPTKIRGLLNLF